MGIEFNRIITLLRKERGITQKQAAQDLGISQAQLSHYEKGIRECGLAFVVQVADYYDVSCDYLLGRSAERSGQTITVEELPEGNSATGGSVYRGSSCPRCTKSSSRTPSTSSTTNCRRAGTSSLLSASAAT